MILSKLCGMAILKTITATDVKNSLGTILADVQGSREPVIIERHGRPYAVIVSWDEWQHRTGDMLRVESPWLQLCRERLEKSALPSTPRKRRA